MKKKNTEKIDSQRRLSERRHEINQRRKSKFYNPNRPSNPAASILKGKFITAPEVISIYQFGNGEDDHFSRTMQFVSQIKRSFRRERCIFDFRNTTHVSAAAMIVVYAALDNAQDLGFEESTILWAERSRVVNTAIKQTKISNLIEGREVKYAFDPGKHLPVISSYGSVYMEDILDYIQQKVFKNKMPPETEHIYGDAVSETINNVGYHAYPKKLGRDKRWWLLCNLIGNDLYLAIYDNGIGIPNTVVDNPWFFTSLERVYPDQYSELKKEVPGMDRKGIASFLFQKLNDPELIALSMAGNISGTRDSKRGQGSKSIKALVDETDSGKLWVFSNKGLYRFMSESMDAEVIRLPSALPGTLVQWNIKLS